MESEFNKVVAEAIAQPLAEVASMKNAQKPDRVSLNTLLNRLKEGRYTIPDFQREFEWAPWDIRDLMRSIFLDYYIGSLLLWKGKKENFKALSCEPIYGHQGDSTKEYIVLDGQQRLTAIHYAFIAPECPLANRANRCLYYIRVDRLMAEESDEAFHYQFLTQHWIRIFANRELQFKDHIFPLSVIGAGGWELPNWVQGYEWFWLDKVKNFEQIEDSSNAKLASHHAENARKFGDLLKGITEEYQISFIELNEELGIEKVCDIFTQINSRGVRLDIFDLINALLKPKGLQLKYMWRDAAPRLEFVESEKLNVYILQVMSILRQSYCSPKYLYFLMPGQEKPIRSIDGTRKEVLVADAQEFEQLWYHAVNTLEDAIKLLRHPQEFGVVSSNYLPYVTILPVFAALQSDVKLLPPGQQLHAQRKIRYWYWASVFMNRYSGAVESTIARDFLDMKGWFEKDEAKPGLIQEFKSRFKTLDLRRETKRGTSVYNGIFNLLVIQGARDWITGNVPQHDDLHDHHIVPASWGKKYIKGTAIHTILNRTPLTAKTNRDVVGDRLPNEYLSDLVTNNEQATVREILASHFISPLAQEILMREPFTPDDYEAFITERQRTLQQAIESLLIKERIDLSPPLRELDERIEKIELSLRSLIDQTLEGNWELVPQRVRDNVEERIQRAIKKNSAALNADNYEILSGKLEFFDLRELQDCIVLKGLWPRFESYFANKNTLLTKFDQLAELRNGIRHSRTVNDITLKEGEAAALWFEKVLAN